MSPSPNPEPDQQPSQPESPEVAVADQPVKVRRPGWKSPLFTPPPSNDDAATDAGTGPSPSSPESSAPRPDPSATKTGSSRESSPADPKLIAQAVSTAFLTATTLAHEYGARDEIQQQLGLYLADEQDVEGVSAPVASLVGRRMGGGLGAANPDVGDAIAAAIALAGYATKQIAKLLTARRLARAGVAVDGLQPTMPAGDAEDPAA